MADIMGSLLCDLALNLLKWTSVQCQLRGWHRAHQRGQMKGDEMVSQVDKEMATAEQEIEPTSTSLEHDSSTTHSVNFNVFCMSFVHLLQGVQY